MIVRVRQGKGGKDRYSILSQRTLDHLRHYWRHYRPTEWLFEGAKKEDPITPHSVQSDTPRKAGGLMSGAASKAVDPLAKRRAKARLSYQV